MKIPSNQLLGLCATLCLVSSSVFAQSLQGITHAVAGKTGLASLSQQINRKAWNRLRGLARPCDYAQVQTARNELPQHAMRQVFQVQKGAFSHSTACAFALNINGRVWGVTAAHVIKNIHLDPHMVVKNEWGKLISAPIIPQHTSSVNGSDVAIFEIPKELLPYVEILQPADKIPTAQTVTQSPCFIRGNPIYLPSEDILFAGPHRLLLRDQAHREMTGYCGSPVLVEGKVVGLHVGTYSLQDIQLANWSSLLLAQNIHPQSALHIAAPIQRVKELAQQFEMKGSQKHIGTPLKVMGQVITLLGPQEHIFSVQQLRNGTLQKTLHSHPFINFDKLEEFFDLQENDVLRITIVSPRNISHAKEEKIYDVNVSTGQVSRLNL